MSFMLYKLRNTYLSDNYDKYVIHLLKFRLDLSWLVLVKNYFQLRMSIDCIKKLSI